MNNLNLIIRIHGLNSPCNYYSIHGLSSVLCNYAPTRRGVGPYLFLIYIRKFIYSYFFLEFYKFI